jgi:hypothetical protein
LSSIKSLPDLIFGSRLDKPRLIVLLDGRIDGVLGYPKKEVLSVNTISAKFDARLPTGKSNLLIHIDPIVASEALNNRLLTPRP